jgi:hypothetical protein
MPKNTTQACYVHEDPATGEFQVVDGNGVPVPSPPWVMRDPADPSAFVAAGTGGAKVPIPMYEPPTRGVYVYEDPATGEFQAVDANGVPIPSPPWVMRDPADPSAFVAAGTGGSKIPMPKYEPPTTDVYVYEDPATGEFHVVDANGVPVPSPPLVQRWGPEGAFATTGPDGDPIPMPKYQPPVGPPSEEEPPSEEGDAEESTGQAPTAQTETEEPAEETTSETETAGTEGSEPSGGRGAFAEGADAARNYSAVEMQEGPVRTDGDLNETPERGVPEPVEASVTGLEAAELSEVTRAPVAEGPAGIEVADQAAGAAGDQVSVIPINIPIPRPPEGDEVEGSADHPAGAAGDQVSVIPINLPIPRPPEGDEVEGSADHPAGAAGDQVSVIPINLPIPRPPEGDEVEGSADHPAGAAGDQVSAIPITVPMPPPPWTGQEIEGPADAEERLADMTPLDDEDIADLRSPAIESLEAEEPTGE